VLGYFSSVFWSLEPESGALVRVLLWGLALLALFLAFRPRRKAPQSATQRFLIRWLCHLPIGLFLLVLMGWTHAYGYLTALFVSASGTIVSALVEGIGLSWCLWRFFKAPKERYRVLAIAQTLLFAGAMQFVLYALWMWSPPGHELCREVSRSNQVTLISPPHWPAELSQPYTLLYVPEKDGLVASFKMAGNGALPFWNDPNANRILAHDLSGESEPVVMPLSGPNYPIHLIYEAELEQLLVSRVGRDEHSLDLIDLSAFPAMTRRASVDVSYPPHDLVSYHQEEVFGVFTQHGTLNWVNQSDLVSKGALALGKGGGPASVTLNGWRVPGSSKVYVSMLLHPLVEVDLVTREARWSDMRLGGGYLAGDGDSKELVATDHLFNSVDVLDMASLKVKRSLDVDYTPRPLQIDPQRDLLMVGGWFDGLVRFYRLSSLEQIGPTLPFGTYLRDLAFDPRRGLLFGASKCGVYQVAVDPLLAQGAAGGGE